MLMARRSDHSRDEIQKMALEAAETIVESGGHEALTARKVAKAIGYTQGTLYHVFENLADLTLQVNGRTLDQLYKALKIAAEAASGPEDRVLALGQAYVRFAREHPHRWAMIFEPTLPADQAAPPWLVIKTTHIFALVEDALGAIAGGAGPEVARAARALWSGVHGVCILSLTHSLDDAAGPAEQLAESLIRNYLRGFKLEQSL